MKHIFDIVKAMIANWRSTRLTEQVNNAEVPVVDLAQGEYRRTYHEEQK